MTPEQPKGGMFDIRWRIFGMRFCIQPSFFIVTAILAYLMYEYIRQGVGGISLIAYILVWIFCSLVTVMVHELGHLITGRIFGETGSVTLTGFGGQTVGDYHKLRPWQRILLSAAGPGAGFGLVAFLIFFDPYTTMWNFWMDFFDWPSLKLRWCIVDQIDPLFRMGASPIYQLTLAILLVYTLFLNVINLLPIIPMDGGMIFMEICCLIAPKSGLIFAFVWSFVLATIVALFYLVVVLMKYRIIPTMFPYPFLFPEFSLFAFAMMAYRAYSTYRELAAVNRGSQYAERDDY